MELVHIEINNYRSIEKLELDLERNTKVFIGVSETGKSNLLKALNVINPNYNFEKKDIRENISYDSQCEIKYKIKLSETEKKQLIEVLKNNYQYINLDKLFISNKKYIPLSKLFNDCFIYTINVENETKNVKSIFKWENLQINPNIKIVVLNGNNTLTISNESNDSHITIKGTNYIDEENFSISDNMKENFN